LISRICKAFPEARVTIWPVDGSDNYSLQHGCFSKLFSPDEDP
jgi:hypothetical protein